MKNYICFLAGVVLTLLLPWDIHELIRNKAGQFIARVTAQAAQQAPQTAVLTAAATETPLPAAAATPAADAKADGTADTVKDEAKSGADKDYISPEDTKAILDSFNSGSGEEK